MFSCAAGPGPGPINVGGPRPSAAVTRSPRDRETGAAQTGVRPHALYSNRPFGAATLQLQGGQKRSRSQPAQGWAPWHRCSSPLQTGSDSRSRGFDACVLPDVDATALCAASVPGASSRAATALCADMLGRALASGRSHALREG